MRDPRQRRGIQLAANLADCFRLQTGIATAMVDYPIGDLIAERVRAMGVKPFYKHFKHDGVHGPNMATVYSDRGQGVRAPVVFYNRCNEAGGAAQARRFRLEGNLRRRRALVPQRRHFRRAVPETTAEVIIEGMQAAKPAGAVTSFDLNYRAKLWNIVGGHERAVAVLDRIVKNVDVLVGNEEDLQLGLGIPGPEVARQVQARSERVLQHDGQRHQETSPHQGRGDDAARSSLHQPPQLGRGRVGRRQDLHIADVRTGRDGPRRRRRRLRGGILLRPAHRRRAGRKR